ncbi:MAG: cupin domain-containing protein [Oscillospiraceae bacterium]|jgi:glucose-6-phosphate isomerase|nr:cupin domain-containing protein [Oscillospiraceae bacterium]
MNAAGSSFDWNRGFALDFALTDGLSQTAVSTKRRLSQMRGMYSDDAAFEALVEREDPLVYEFYELGAPERAGDLAFGTSITYPGRVGREYFMTKGHFHTILDTAEVYYCLSGRGVMLMENPEGDVVWIPLEPGKVAYVPRRYAHRSVNTGDTPFVTFFVFRADAGHDYGTIEKKGCRKLVVEQDGAPRMIDNPKWK